MKKFFYYWMFLSMLLLVLCSCGNSDSTDAAKNAAASSKPILRLSESETEEFMNDFLTYVSDFSTYYSDFVNELNSKTLSYSDITEFQEQWSKKYISVSNTLDELQSYRFDEQYNEVYDSVYNIASDMCSICEKLSDWDSNEDGEITTKEVEALVLECADMLKSTDLDGFDKFLEIKKSKQSS